MDGKVKGVTKDLEGIAPASIASKSDNQEPGAEVTARAAETQATQATTAAMAAATAAAEADAAAEDAAAKATEAAMAAERAAEDAAAARAARQRDTEESTAKGAEETPLFVAKQVKTRSVCCECQRKPCLIGLPGCEA